MKKFPVVRANQADTDSSLYHYTICGPQLDLEGQRGPYFPAVEFHDLAMSTNQLSFPDPPHRHERSIT